MSEINDLEAKRIFKNLVRKVKFYRSLDKEKDFTNEEVAERMDLKLPYFNTLVGTKGKVTMANIKNLISAFSDILTDDDITNSNIPVAPSKPDFYIPGKTQPREISTKIIHSLNEPGERIVQIDQNGNEIIPITDLTVAAGGGIFNEETIESIDSIQLPERLVNSGYHLCVRIKGHSMSPTLQDGGFMIIRKLEKSEYKQIQNEHIYAITYTENHQAVSILKRVKNRFNKGFVVAMSDNPDKATYPNITIDAKEIVNIWHAEWYFTARMPNIHDQYYTRLQRLEDIVEEIMKNLK